MPCAIVVERGRGAPADRVRLRPGEPRCAASTATLSLDRDATPCFALVIG